MKIEIDDNTVTINGRKYVTIEKWPGFEGKVVTIKEVRPVYGDGFSWLFIGFDMPKMKFNVGDKIKIIKEA